MATQIPGAFKKFKKETHVLPGHPVLKRNVLQNLKTVQEFQAHFWLLKRTVTNVILGEYALSYTFLEFLGQQKHVLHLPSKQELGYCGWMDRQIK